MVELMIMILWLGLVKEARAQTLTMVPSVASESPTVKPTVTIKPVTSPTVTISLSPTEVEPSLTPIPTEIEQVVTPTPISQPKATDQSLVVIFLSAVIGLLVIIILAQAWPRDKEEKE
ncbi:MAG: hypothetical protein WC596_03600 [Candidatus Shapirobacteria bacterium]